MIRAYFEAARRARPDRGIRCTPGPRSPRWTKSMRKAEQARLARAAARVSEFASADALIAHMVTRWGVS